MSRCWPPAVRAWTTPGCAAYQGWAFHAGQLAATTAGGTFARRVSWYGPAGSAISASPGERSRNGSAVGGAAAGDGCRGASVGVAVANTARAAGSTVAVGTVAVFNGCAASAASSIRRAAGPSCCPTRADSRRRPARRGWQRRHTARAANRSDRRTRRSAAATAPGTARAEAKEVLGRRWLMKITRPAGIQSLMTLIMATFAAWRMRSTTMAGTGSSTDSSISASPRGVLRPNLHRGNIDVSLSEQGTDQPDDAGLVDVLRHKQIARRGRQVELESRRSAPHSRGRRRLPRPRWSRQPAC